MHNRDIFRVSLISRYIVCSRWNRGDSTENAQKTIFNRRYSGDVIDKDCTGIPRVGWQEDAIWKVYGGILKYIINYDFYLARYDAYFHINDDAKKYRSLSVTNNFIFSHNLFKLLSHEVL